MRELRGRLLIAMRIPSDEGSVTTALSIISNTFTIKPLRRGDIINCRPRQKPFRHEFDGGKRQRG